MSLCGLRLCSSGKNVYFCTFIVQKEDKIDSLMLKLFTGTIYDLRSWRLELICLLESSSLLRLSRGVAGLLRIMTFTWKHQVLIRNDPVDNIHLFLHLVKVLSGVPQVLPGRSCRHPELLEGVVQLGHGPGVGGGGGTGQPPTHWDKLECYKVSPLRQN